MTNRHPQSVLAHQPFQPFMMHLVDGRSLNIRHPEAIFILEDGRAAVFDDTDGSRHLIDLRHIIELAFGPQPQE